MKALNHRKEAAETLQSSKNRQGHVEKYRKHFTCTPLPPVQSSSEQRQTPWRDFTPWEKERSTPGSLVTAVDIFSFATEKPHFLYQHQIQLVEMHGVPTEGTELSLW